LASKQSEMMTRLGGYFTNVRGPQDRDVGKYQPVSALRRMRSLQGRRRNLALPADPDKNIAVIVKDGAVVKNDLAA
jgi:hypothetical protein